MLKKDDLLRRREMWNAVLGKVRSFFDSRGFLEVDTPLLASTPGMEPNLDPFTVEVKQPGGSLKIMGLITSPEYAMKKLLGEGLEKIYTITPVFRNNESGSRNTPEFTMLEWYAPGGYQDLMDETEALLKSVLSDGESWPRIAYDEAGMDEHGDPHVDLDRFFVTHYPPEQAALAKLSEDKSYAERFEAFASGMELCNGFCELTNADEQRKRFVKEQEQRRAAGKHVFPIDEELLDAISCIKKSVYGNALGVDRLVMLKYGVSSIHDIQLFPYAESK